MMRVYYPFLSRRGEDYKIDTWFGEVFDMFTDFICNDEQKNKYVLVSLDSKENHGLNINIENFNDNVKCDMISGFKTVKRKAKSKISVEIEFEYEINKIFDLEDPENITHTIGINYIDKNKSKKVFVEAIRELLKLEPQIYEKFLEFCLDNRTIFFDLPSSFSDKKY